MIEAERMDGVDAAGDEILAAAENKKPVGAEEVDRAGTDAAGTTTGSTNGQAVDDATAGPAPVPESSGDQGTGEVVSLPPIQIPKTGEEMIAFVSRMLLLVIDLSDNVSPLTDDPKSGGRVCRMRGVSENKADQQVERHR